MSNKFSRLRWYKAVNPVTDEPMWILETPDRQKSAVVFRTEAGCFRWFIYSSNHVRADGHYQSRLKAMRDARRALVAQLTEEAEPLIVERIDSTPAGATAFKMTTIRMSEKAKKQMAIRKGTLHPKKPRTLK